MQTRYASHHVRGAQRFVVLGATLAIMPLHLPWSTAACAVENKSTVLTTSERELGKRLGISEEALAEIRDALKPEMAAVKIGGLEEPDDTFVEFRAPNSRFYPKIAGNFSKTRFH